MSQRCDVVMMSHQKIGVESWRGELEAHEYFLHFMGSSPSYLVLGRIHSCPAYLEATPAYYWSRGQGTFVLARKAHRGFRADYLT